MANTVTEELGEADQGQPYTPRMSNSPTPPHSPRISPTIQIRAKSSPAETPRLASRVSQSVAKASPAVSPRASTTSQSMAADTLPSFRSSRTSRSIAEMRYNCVTPSLSVASLVQPVQDDDDGTIEEDLVSSGESIGTEEL